MKRLFEEEHPTTAEQLSRLYTTILESQDALKSLEKIYGSQARVRTLEEKANSVGLTIKSMQSQRDKDD